ncbi:MAG: hypothetical protein IT368_13740 [Candidatus Hydrogenedentes bacterium]|nr:hypothetical protein [Candidatus Hydrogenedentota bacterium]
MTDPFTFEHSGIIVGLRERPVDDNDDDLLAAVNRFTLRPLAADDFVVFTLDLCHNKIDRHFSRFPEEELEIINELIVGRPLMERHDLRGSLPRGTFFRSRLHREGDVVSVRPEVYVLRTPENESFIRSIEGGVYRDTSIGFSFRTPECSICGRDLRTCDHVPGREYNGDACHFIMREVIDVIEGSIVASGSQGTRFVAQSRESPIEALVQDRRHATPPAATAILELAERHQLSTERIGALVEDGLTARRRALARFCGLGKELDGATFDEAAWRATLEHVSLDTIHQHLRAYEVRFDQKYPPAPTSQPEPLDFEEARTAKAQAILREN